MKIKMEIKIHFYLSFISELILQNIIAIIILNVKSCHKKYNFVRARARTKFTLFINTFYDFTLDFPFKPFDVFLKKK